MREPVTVDIQEGSGRPAMKRDVVTARITMKLSHGETVLNGQIKSFQIGARSVIAGLEQGVIGMRRGGLRSIVFGPHLGYGSAGAGTIPPNAKLDCRVELLELFAEDEPGPTGIRRMIKRKGTKTAM